MQVAINLPNEFVVLQPIQEIEHDMRLSYALWLFKNAKVTLSKAAELAAMDIYTFLAECKKNEVPVMNRPRKNCLKNYRAWAHYDFSCRLFSINCLPNSYNKCNTL